MNLNYIKNKIVQHKIIILTFFGVIIFFVVGIFTIKRNNPKSDLLQRVPQDVQRMISLKFDSNVKKNPFFSGSRLLENYSNIVDGLDQVVFFEMQTGGEVMSVMLAKTNDRFSIEKAYQAGLFLQTGGESVQYLEPNIIVYSNDFAYNSIKEKKLISIKNNNDLEDLIKHDDYQIKMFSKVDPGFAPLGDQDLQHFVEKLSYATIGARIDESSFHGELKLLSNTGLFESPQINFSHHFNSYLTEKTIAFLEAAPINQLFGVSQEDLKATVDSFLESVISSGDRKNIDTTQISDLFSQPIAISLTRNLQPWGFGLSLISNNISAFSGLNQIFFASKKTLNEMGSGLLTFVNDADQFGVLIKVPYAGVVSETELLVLRTGNTLLINLGNPLFEGSYSSALPSDNTIMASLLIDGNNLNQRYQQLSLFGLFQEPAWKDLMNRLKNKKFEANLKHTTQTLELDFVLK